MGTRLQGLMSRNQKLDISDMEIAFIIENKPLVTVEFIASYFGRKSKRPITNWIKRGMPKHNLSTQNLMLFELEECIKWARENINEEKNHAINKNVDIDPTNNPYEDMLLDDVPKHEAERRKEIEAVKKLQMQNKALRGQFIDIDEVDKDMASLATMLLASMKNVEKSYPVEYANTSSQEMLDGLKSAHFAATDMLDRIIQKEFDCNETLYEIIHHVLVAIDNGKTPKQIIDDITLS